MLAGMSEAKTEPSGGTLSAVQGTAMYVGAVLGTGVIALPALAAEAAGPASLLAWLALVVLSAPWPLPSPLWEPATRTPAASPPTP